MLENSEPIFNDFIEYVNRMKAELACVNAKYCTDTLEDELATYREKCNIYTRYTEDLINNGFQYLDVISHLRKELARNHFDVSSNGSNSTISEGTVHADISFVRERLENHLGMEDKAFESLTKGKNFFPNLLNFISLFISNLTFI